jgi:Arc/MetJ-type ribon-helix-helix transcriptional regulator
MCKGVNDVVNMTLAIPSELKKEMDELRFVNWSEVARDAFKAKISEWQLFQSILKKSKLTQKDADEISRKINKAASERLLKEYQAMRK